MMTQEEHTLEYLGKKYYIFLNNNSEVDIFEEICNNEFLDKALEKRLKLDDDLDQNFQGSVVVVPLNGGLHLSDKLYHYYKKQNIPLKFLSIENYSYVGKQKKKEVTTTFLFDYEIRKQLIKENGIKVSIPESSWISRKEELDNISKLTVCDDVYDEGNSLIGIFEFLKSAFKKTPISCFYQFHKLENSTNKKKMNFENSMEKIRETGGRFYSALLFTENQWVGGCGADIGLKGYEHAGRNIHSLILKIPTADRLYKKVLNQYKKTLDIRSLQ